VLVERFGFDEDPQLAQTPRRGWLVLEGNAGDDPFGRAGAAIAAIRKLGQRPQMPSVVPVKTCVQQVGAARALGSVT